jgi:hypothetical protein
VYGSHANAKDDVEVFLVDAQDLALLSVPDRPALGMPWADSLLRRPV